MLGDLRLTGTSYSDEHPFLFVVYGAADFPGVVIQGTVLQTTSSEARQYAFISRVKRGASLTMSPSRGAQATILLFYLDAVD